MHGGVPRGRGNNVAMIFTEDKNKKRIRKE
jgi:hypothetical protein